MTELLYNRLSVCIQEKNDLFENLSIHDHFLSIYWEEQVKLYGELEESCNLIKMRDISETILRSLENLTLYKAPDVILWNNVELPFYYVRHLCFSGYIILSWNIYDRLTSFYVRMMAPDGIQYSDKKQMPSLQKLFFNPEVRKKFSPFGCSQIADEFLPYIQVSYKIRNTLAHEGNCDRNISIFKDNMTPKFSFVPNDDFLKLLSASIVSDKYDSVAKKNEIDNCRDLKEILFPYNYKIDELFSALITHASDCFIAHLKAWH